MLILPNRRQWRQKPPPSSCRINKAHPLASNLVWLSLMNGYTTADANIASQTGQYCNDTATNTPRIFNGEMIMSASGDREYVSNTNTPYSPHFTAISWIKRNASSAGTYCSLASHHTTSGVGSGWYWYIHNDDKIKAEIPWIGSTLVSSTQALSTGLRVGDWIQVALSRGGGTGSWNWKLYINGVVDGSVAGDTTNPATADQLLSIQGLTAASANGGRCAMREFVLFNKELSAAEIGQFRNDPYALLEPFRGAAYAPIASAAAGGSAYYYAQTQGLR